jgi:tripartite-type tricarboxylate transporter receptor subunit TctC
MKPFRFPLAPLGAARRRLLCSAVALMAVASSAAAFPDRPITLIVPWSAGGGTDATGRFVATLLEKELK